jgi:hypothetical protein
MYNLYMPLLRKIFFYIFTLIYLIICPVIILRMLGFVMDPHTGRWVKTGIIYVSTNPPGAKVSINGVAALEPTPTIIRDLTPGTYTIRLQLAGYKPWENNIPVVDKKATSLENILLLPENWKITSLASMPLAALISIPDTNYLLVSTDSTVKNTLILRIDKDIEELVPLFPEESIYRESLVKDYFTIDKSPFFVLRIDTGEKHKYLWIDPREPQVHIEDLSDLLPAPPSRLFWEPNDEKTIYAFYNNYVNRINIKEKAIYPNIESKDIPLEKKAPAALNLPKADQTFLINNANTFLFRKGQDVFLKDKENFGEPRLIKVLRTLAGTDIYFSERTGKLYYVDSETHLLSSLQILHHKAFIPKPIAATLRLER